MLRALCRAFVSFIILLASSTFSYSQSNEAVKVETELVTLDVQVQDKKSGRIVGGLKKEDFLLYEEGSKQAISHFSQVDILSGLENRRFLN